MYVDYIPVKSHMLLLSYERVSSFHWSYHELSGFRFSENGYPGTD